MEPFSFLGKLSLYYCYSNNHMCLVAQNAFLYFPTQHEKVVSRFFKWSHVAFNKSYKMLETIRGNFGPCYLAGVWQFLQSFPHKNWVGKKCRCQVRYTCPRKFFMLIFVNRRTRGYIFAWSFCGGSSGISSVIKTSAMRKESVELLLILIGARRRSLLGVQGRRRWALWEGVTTVSVSVSVSQGGLCVSVSISAMNAGFSMPASVRNVGNTNACYRFWTPSYELISLYTKYLLTSYCMCV